MPLDLVPLGRLSSIASALWVYGFAGLLLGAPLAWTILRFLRHARAAARAEANEAKPPRLEPGPATLCGTVETADRRPALVLTVVEVRPAPSLFRKSTLTWEERSRKLSPVAGELRRSPTRPMLVGSGTLGAAHRRARSWYGKAALALGAAFFVVHLGVFSG